MDQTNPKREAQIKAFTRLLDIMDELREKCPWDKKQTFQSLSRLTIEEVYEVVEAIDNKDTKELEGELGDLFLHLVFYSKIGEEENYFDVASVLNKVCEKLIFRHPHIYGDIKAEDEEQVKKNWEQLKLKEGRESALEGVPNALPALLRAQRIQEKASGVGFDFNEIEQAKKKIKEEIDEFLEETTSEGMKDEFGDLLFSLVNSSRFLKLNAEESLTQSSNKFKKRFESLEKLVKKEFGSFDRIYDKNKMEELWNYVKLNP